MVDIPDHVSPQELEQISQASEGLFQHINIMMVCTQQPNNSVQNVSKVRVEIPL